VRTQSLVSLPEGGVAFDTPTTATASPPASAEATFTLYSDRTNAMKVDESIATRYLLFFTESVRGLAVGAPVSFFGVPVGEVTEVGLGFNAKTLDVRPRVEIVLYPERVIARLSGAQEKQALALVGQKAIRHAIVQKMVEQRGLRAQLATGSLVTGSRYVSLAYFPKLQKSHVDWSAEEPELPTTLSTLPEVEEKLGRIIDKLEKLPLEAIGQDLTKALVSMDETLRDARGVIDHFDADVVPALKSALDDARGALGSAERMLTSTEANLVGPGAPGQVELRNAMQELARAARSLRTLADYLEQHPDALIRGKTAQPMPK